VSTSEWSSSMLCLLCTKVGTRQLCIITAASLRHGAPTLLRHHPLHCLPGAGKSCTIAPMRCAFRRWTTSGSLSRRCSRTGGQIGSRGAGQQGRQDTGELGAIGAGAHQLL